MKPEDLTVEVLREIRDDARLFREETRAGFAAVGQKFEEVGQKFEEVGRRIVDSEVRTATAISDLAGTLHEVRDELRASLELRPRVDRCERDIADIKHRLG